MNLADARSVAAPSLVSGIGAALLMRMLDPAEFGVLGAVAVVGAVFGVQAIGVGTVVALMRLANAPALAARQDSEIILDLPFHEAVTVANMAIVSNGAKVTANRALPDSHRSLRARIPAARSHWGARVRVSVRSLSAKETLIRFESRPRLLPDYVDTRELHLEFVRAFMYTAMDMEAELLQGRRLGLGLDNGEATTATSSS